MISVAWLFSMTEPAPKRTLYFRKTATGVDFQVPINFEETLKGVKPPIIPPLIRSVCEEILARIASRQLSILPAPLSTLFFNSDAMGGSLMRSAQIDEVIKLLHFNKKGLSEQQRIIKRKADLEPHRTSIITRAMFRYIEMCSDGIDLAVNFPAYGYLIIGPPPHHEGKPDIKSYTHSLESFIRTALNQNPIKRDIFCYLMNFLSQIYQLMADSYRSEPALCGMTRYLLAYRFGEEMVTPFCTSCEKSIRDGNGCEVCSFITTRIKPPYCARIIDMMLQYVPLSYWRDLLNDPRGGFANPRGISTKIDDLKFFAQRSASGVGDMPHAKAAPEGEATIGKIASKLSSHGSTENNGVSIQKSRSDEPRKNEKNKENESVSSRGSLRKTNSIEAPRTNLGDGGGAFYVGSRGSVGGVGGGIISAALRRDSVSSISLSRKPTPSNGTRSTLFTTPPSVSRESRESTMSQRSSRLNVLTSKSQKKKKKTPKQHKSRSKTRKPRARSGSRKRQKKTRSGSRRRKSRGRSPRRKKEVEKNRGKKNAGRRPRSKTKRRDRSRRRHRGNAMHNVHIMAF